VRKWAISVLERWQQWAAGESVPDAAAGFATTIEVLTDNEQTIDALLGAKS
jgi:hypothetical protein